MFDSNRLTRLMRNITFGDTVMAYVSKLSTALNIIHKIRTMLKYRKLYRNYVNVLINIKRENYPIKAVTLDGNSIILRNERDVRILDGRNMPVVCDISNDIAYVNFSGKELTIHGGVTNGDVKAIFVDKIYESLPVKDKTVIDVGGNIADSAIFFCISGAAKVVCIEPFPKNYELAELNIKLNNFSYKISLVLGGCSDKVSEITIDPAYRSGGDSILTHIQFETGIKIPLLTLEDILNKYGLQFNSSTVLKMDCEGCEYESVLSTSEEVLRKFSDIMIEYHFGYKNLKQKLEQCNFLVSVTRPTMYKFSPDEYNKKINFAEGCLYARRI
jgi:FkbM family methyltransferase